MAVIAFCGAYELVSDNKSDRLNAYAEDLGCFVADTRVKDIEIATKRQRGDTGRGCPCVADLLVINARADSP